MEMKMNKIQKISKILQGAFAVYLILIPLNVLFIWIFSALIPWKETFIGTLFNNGILSADFKALGKIYSIYDIDFSWTARFIGLAGDFFFQIFVWLAAFYVFKLMKLYAAGNLFSRIHALYFKRMGQFLLLYGTVGIIAGDTLHGIAVTIDNPPGQRMLTIGFGSPNVEMIVISMIITLVGWVMLEGFKLRSDHDLTI